MAAAARSALRVSSSLRSAAFGARRASASAARPPLRLRGPRPPVPRFPRTPVEASFCLESLMPMHSATAAALMTSMLAVSRRGYSWLSEAMIASSRYILRHTAMFKLLNSLFPGLGGKTKLDEGQANKAGNDDV